MVSDQGSGFTEAMGYKQRRATAWMPGVSVFQKQNGDKIMRVSDTAFGPGDDFCAVWHLFDMIPQGPDGWQPQYTVLETAKTPVQGLAQAGALRRLPEFRPHWKPVSSYAGAVSPPCAP